MVDFSQIYKLLNDNNVSGSTNNNGSVNSNTENYENISVFSNDNSSPNSTSQLDDEEFLWWEERLEEKRQEELENNKNTADNNYFDIDIETIKNLEVQGNIQIDETNSISTNEYINYLLNQKVGFDTEEEYQQYVLDKFTSYLNDMKSTYQAQEDSNGWFSNLYDGAKELFGLGTSSKDAEDSIAKYEQMVQGLTDAINGNSDMTFEQAYEYYTGTSYSKEKIDKYIETSNIYSAVMVGCQLDEDYIEKFEQSTGKSVDEVMQNYAQCQLETFGEVSDVKNIIDEYVQDQQTYSDKLSSIISTAGIVCTVVGAVSAFVFPPAAPLLMTIGKTLSIGGMYIDNVIDLVDDATDKDGLTKDEVKDLALETGVEAVSYAAGRGIGKLTNGLNNVVSSKVAEAGAGKVTSYIAGQAAETVVDTGLSLAADYTIAQGQSLITTGKFMDAEDYWSLDRFLGEGKNQLIGILTGLSSAKVDAYQQGVIKTAQGLILEGDTDGAKTYLKKSGIKMNDSSFESFVKNVQDVDTQMKLQAPQVEEAQRTVDTEAQKPVDADVVDGKNPFAVEDTDSDSVKPVEADDSVEVTDGLAGKIGIQFFAEKNTETDSANSDVDYSKMTYAEKIKLLEDKGVIQSDDTARLDESQTERALKCLDKGVDVDIIEDLVTTFDNAKQDERVIYLLSRGVEEIYDIATLDDTSYERALNLLDKGLKDSLILNIIDLDDTQIEEAIKLTNNGISWHYIEDFATSLDDVQIEKALKLTNSGVQSDYIKDLATSLDDAQFEKALKLANSGVQSDYIKDLATSLEETQVDNAIKLSEAGVYSGYIKDLAGSLDEVQIEQAIKLANNGVRADYIKDLAGSLDEVQIEQAIKLANNGVRADYIKDLAGSLDEAQIEQAIKLANNGVRADYIKDLAGSLDEVQIEQAIKLANNGVRADYIKDLASSLDEAQIEQAIKLANNGIETDYIKDLAGSLDEAQIERALKLTNNGVYYIKSIRELATTLDRTQIDNAFKLYEAGVRADYIKDLAGSLDDTQIENALKLVNNGIRTANIKDLALSLNDTQIELAIKLVNNGIRTANIKDLALSLNDTQIELAIKLVNNEVDIHYIRELATTLEGTQVDNVIALKNAGVIESLIKDIVTLEEPQVNNAIKLAQAGIDPFCIKDIATLEETQINNAIKLYNAGLNSVYVKDIATLEGTQVDNAIKLVKAGIDGSKIKRLATILDDTQTDSYIYFNNLSTNNGDKIFTKEDSIFYMFNLDASSAEASNFDMLINLVQDGVVDKHVIEYLPILGKLNPAVVSDIDKLYEAHTLGIESADAIVPTFKNVEEAMQGGNDSISFKDTFKDIKAGDVFQVESEDFIRIKISDTESKQLNISKETYLKLFPPIERYATTQNQIANCWELTGINSLLCEADTRASILELFSQDGNNIVIKFPNGQYAGTVFENGELPTSADKRYYSKGALGIQMLEYADGVEIQLDKINSAYKKISEMIANEPDKNKRKTFEEDLINFTRFIEYYNGNVEIDLDNGIQWKQYEGEYDSIMSKNRNGGYSNTLYTRVGYKEAQSIELSDENGFAEAQYLLKDSKSFDNYVISFATGGNGMEATINPQLGIVSNHAYRIKPATVDSNGEIKTFKLINPWGILETELTYEQVLNYGRWLFIAKK